MDRKDGTLSKGKPAARAGDRVNCPLHGTVSINTGSPNISHNGQPAARIGDTTSCGDTIIEGSGRVYINGKPAAFLGCATAHGGRIIDGSSTVFIDGSIVHADAATQKTSPPRPSNYPRRQVMVASENAVRFTASFEAIGFICPDGKLRAYQDRGCKRGFWTVGIGEMTGRGKDSSFSSEAEAYTSFAGKIKGEYSERVRQALKRAGVRRLLSQNEFDALVDLAYQKGNCKKLAEKIAHGDNLTEADFVAQTGPEHQQRRKAEFALFSGRAVTVKGPTRYLRFDNTNGGYCPENGKPGFGTERSGATYELTY